MTSHINARDRHPFGSCASWILIPLSLLLPPSDLVREGVTKVRERIKGEGRVERVSERRECECAGRRTEGGSNPLVSSPGALLLRPAMTGTLTLRTGRRDALAQPLHLFTMSALLYTFLGLAMGTLHCSVRPDISPCTCTLQIPGRKIQIACERMSSFAQVLESLSKGNFTASEPQNGEPLWQLSLRIAYSDLEDLEMHRFKDLGFGMEQLKLNFNNLTTINQQTFANMSETKFLSLADNSLIDFPAEALSHMPDLMTLDLARNRLSTLTQSDFKALQRLQYLILPGNSLSRIERGTFPRGIINLHIGHNEIANLNGSISSLTSLKWLFMNGNNLSTLDGQMPSEGLNMILLHAGNNQLTKLPMELNSYPRLESLFLQHNRLTSLGGAVQRLKKLVRLHIHYNNIETILNDEFLELESLQDLQAGYNQITALNGSLLPLRTLKTLNLTHNLLPEFSLHEIKGLKNLQVVDLSHNVIKKLGGKIELQNHVELHTKVLILRLEYNQLEELGGVLGGLSKLQRLNLSHNHLQKITPDDLINLDDLHVLDISFNQLTTLEETSKTQLPKLEELLASNNYLTTVGPDFHGLPVLCSANLQYNKITTIGNELAAKTQCKKHDVLHTLKIYFEGNALVCKDELSEAVTEITKNHTELYGLPDCSNSTTSSSEGE